MHHAFHVFQNCVKMIVVAPQLKDMLSLLDIYALLIAALCHDVDHVGTNNTYHINSWSKLSLRYNDISVMEQHHCSLCFKTLSNPETNVVSTLTYHSRSILRKLICAAILATDMNNHERNLQLIQARAGIPFKKDSLADRMLLVGVVLHTADLCNPCLSLSQSKQWEKRISQEFQFQAALEREYNLPVAPFMESSDQLSRIKNQNHFIDSFAYPQWVAAVQLFPTWAPRLTQLRRNMDYFGKLKDMLMSGSDAKEGSSASRSPEQAAAQERRRSRHSNPEHYTSLQGRSGSADEYYHKTLSEDATETAGDHMRAEFSTKKLSSEASAANAKRRGSFGDFSPSSYRSS